jgi:hypothetical protein
MNSFIFSAVHRKIKKKFCGWEQASRGGGEECLPSKQTSKHKTLSSNPSITKEGNSRIFLYMFV